MFMGNVGVLLRLAYCMGAHAIIFIYLFFPAERAYTPVNNEPAHRHKK